MNLNLHIDNHALVEECRKGDKEALNLLYLRFAPRMHCVIRRYITDTKDVEDILHDGFVVAFTRLDSLRDPERVEYWLATIMRNLSLQFLQNQDVVEILHDLPEVEEAPEIENMIDLETLEVLIRKLPDGYQKVFRLAVLENKSHKEIGKLLGIAPNSSSSQLFHARMMMRRLITEYKLQAGVLSVLLVVVSLLFLRFGTDERNLLLSEAEQEIPASDNNSPISRKEMIADAGGVPVVGKMDIPVEQREEMEEVGNDKGLPAEMDKEMYAERDNVIPAEKRVERRAEDGFVGPVAENVPSTRIEDPVASIDDQIEVRGEQSRWSVRTGVSLGIKNGVGESGDYDMINDNICGGNCLLNPDFEEKSFNRITRGWPEMTMDKTMENLMNASHENDQPLSFSLTASKSISDVVSLETGLTYTYLHSTFETMMSVSDCHWHYLGIPLKVGFRTIGGKKWNLYASAGLEFEIPLVAKSVVSSSFSQPDLYSGRFSAYSLWTATATYGFSFRFTDKIDVFIEPTLQYRFHHKYKVPNVWTDDRFGFSLPIGFRFNL